MNSFRFIKNSEEFHKQRSKTIGAYDIPIILGLSKFCTPYELWRIKTGRSEGFSGNDATRWGTRHEPMILASYIEENFTKLTSEKFLLDYIKRLNKRPENYKPPTQFIPFTEFYHPQIPWAMSHPDLIDMSNDINIEAKSGRQFASIRRGDMDGFDPECDDESGVPLKYYFQIQWQGLTTGINNHILRALIDTNTELSYNIKYSQKIGEKLLDIASRFWYFVQNDKEPSPVNQDDVKNLFPIVNDKASYLTPVESEFAIKMKDRKKFLSEKSKKIEAEIDDINNSLSVLIGANKYLYDGEGNKICSQVQFEKESIAKIEDIKKTDLYDQLKNQGLIKNIKVRYVR